MFFSSKKPTPRTTGRGTSPLAGTLPTGAGLASREQVAMQSLMGGENPEGSVALGSVITDVKDVPRGQYVRFAELGISSDHELSFLCIQTSPIGAEQAVVSLLVAQEAWASHPQFEINRRLREAKCRVGEMRRASREVVRATHDHNRVNAVAEKIHSDTEKSAWDLINSAIQAGASDIHLETRTSFAQVWFRVYGERVEQPNMSMSTATAICNTLYGFHADSNSKETHWDPDSVKECSIEHTTINGTKAQLRFESTPIHPASDKNFQAVIRLLLMEGKAKQLGDVGYTAGHIATIEEVLVGAQGMVLLVGPTNSGKSTAMQAFVERIYEVRGRSIKVVTVEDPVEYVVPSACQMGIPKGRKALEGRDGSVFRTFLKATLRLDPDVVLVGEIRDAESAESTKDLVLTGRKILTTLHVFEAFAAFERLKELGVPPSVLYMEGFITGIIYQRLVPVLCDCAIPFADAIRDGMIRPTLAERIARVADLRRDNVRIRRRTGCEKCKNTGIVGRTVCAELLVPDPTFLAHLRAGDERAARAHWHSDASLAIDDLGVTAVAHAIQKMRAGILDPADIEAQVGPLVVKYATHVGASADRAPNVPGMDRFSGIRMSDEAPRGLAR